MFESLSNTLGSLLGNSDEDTDQTEEQEDEQSAEGEDPVDDSDDGFGFGDEDEEEDVEEQVADLEYELDEANDEIQRLESAIESLQNNQEEVGDELEDVNERIRKLLSLYDKVKESDNPFSGSKPESTTSNNTDKSDDDGDDDDDAFTLEDIENAFDPDDEDDEPEETEPEQTNPQSKYEGVMDDERFLTYPPLTYAGEVVAFDWLAYLMQEAGAAGALKALNYYEEIDWLSPEVRDYMVTLLSAPGIDVNAEVQKVEELSTDTHKASFRYIMKISSVNQEYVIRNHER